jgi:hypothetical protein
VDNGVYHRILATAGGAIDCYYEFSLAATAVGARASITAYLQEAAAAGGDSVDLYLWDWTAGGGVGAWELVHTALLTGTLAATASQHSQPLFARNTGTGANAGKVRVRFYTATAEGITTELGIDQVLVEYAESLGAVLTAQGLTVTRAGYLDNLDAAVSTRSTYAGGAVASVTGAVGSVAGSVGSVASYGTLVADVATAVSASPSTAQASEIQTLTVTGTPATKRVIVNAATALTVYGIVTREADGYQLNDADGAFAAAPADPYHEFTEDSVIKGKYAFSEVRTAWDSGTYTITVYSQAGGSPAPVSDFTLAVGKLVLSGDRSTDVGVNETIIDYALCSLAEAKAERGITISDDDDRMIRAINAATEYMETRTNRKLKRRATPTTDYYDGDTDTRGHDSEQLWPREWPLESDSITSLHDDPSCAFTTGEITSGQRSIHGSGRFIQLSSVAGPGSFNDGRRNIRLIYYPGYTTPPAELKSAAILLALDFFDAEKRLNSTGESVAGQSVSWSQLAINPVADEILKRYERGFEEIGEKRAWLR